MREAPTPDTVIEEISARSGLHPSQVREQLAGAGIVLTQPLPAHRQLMVRRLRVSGVKTGDRAFHVDLPFGHGVFAIVHPENGAGKTSLLEFIVYALRGAPRDLPVEVGGWLRTLRVDLLVSGRPIRIAIDQDEGHRPIASLFEARSEDHLQVAADTELSLIGHAEGSARIEELIGSFMLRTLDLDRLPLWRGTGGTDGQGAAQVHGWKACFGACYLNPGGDKLLLGDTPDAPALSAQLLEVFIDVPYTTQLARVKTASKQNSKVVRQSQVRLRNDAEARASEQDEIRHHLAAARREIEELSSAAVPALQELLVKVDQADAYLRQLRHERTLADEAYRDARADRLRLEQQHLDATESWQARRVLGLLDPTCCPRCEAPIDSGRRTQERNRAHCAVCTRPLPEVNESEIEEALMALEEQLESARQAEEDAEQLLSSRSEQVDQAFAAYEHAAEQVQQFARVSQQYQRLRELELRAARLEGRLAAYTSLPETVESAQQASTIVLEATEQVLTSIVKDATSEVFPLLDAEIIDLAQRFGVQNLDSVRLDRAGRVNAVSDGKNKPFSKFSRGDRLRMRIATVVALLRVGNKLGARAHPGLVLVDALASEEVTARPGRTLVGELQAIAEEIPELQVILTTAQPHLVYSVLPSPQLITSDDRHLF
jgi:hypothetical protein